MLPPLLVEHGMQVVQVPPEPAVGTRFRQSDVTDIENRTVEEVLGCSVEPAQREQRVLTGRRITHLQSLDRPAAQRVITIALSVEMRRLLPQFVGKLVLAQLEVTTLRVQRAEERAAVEGRQRTHVTSLKRVG